MNPGDAAYNNYLVNNVWNNPAVAPGPYAVLADVMGLGYPAEGTAEYGKSILNEPGTGIITLGTTGKRRTAFSSTARARQAGRSAFR